MNIRDKTLISREEYEKLQKLKNIFVHTLAVRRWDNVNFMFRKPIYSSFGGRIIKILPFLINDLQDLYINLTVMKSTEKFNEVYVKNKLYVDKQICDTFNYISIKHVVLFEDDFHKSMIYSDDTNKIRFKNNLSYTETYYYSPDDDNLRTHDIQIGNAYRSLKENINLIDIITSDPNKIMVYDSEIIKNSNIV